jgi:hypothetical protein
MNRQSSRSSKQFALNLTGCDDRLTMLADRNPATGRDEGR